MDYPRLIQILAQPDYAGLSDADAVSLLNRKRHTRTRSRFGSFRTMASLLTPEEYTIAKTTLNGAAGASLLLADMVEMLKTPGDEGGSGGGLDFGDASFRAMCDQLLASYPDIVAKINGYAEFQVSDADENGFGTVTMQHIADARGAVTNG